MTRTSNRLGAPFGLTCPLLVVALASPAMPQNVTYNAEPTSETTLEVGVDPLEVGYAVTATVSDGDNQGLALYAVNLLTDTTLIQSLTVQEPTLIAPSFTVVQSDGTPDDLDGGGFDDDLALISGSQDVFDVPGLLLGVGQAGGLGAPQILITGTLVFPAIPGTYHIHTGPGQGAAQDANVFKLGDLTQYPNVEQADVLDGPGFEVTIIPEPGSFVVLCCLAGLAKRPGRRRVAAAC